MTSEPRAEGARLTDGEITHLLTTAELAPDAMPPWADAALTELQEWRATQNPRPSEAEPEAVDVEAVPTSGILARAFDVARAFDAYWESGPDDEHADYGQLTLVAEDAFKTGFTAGQEYEQDARETLKRENTALRAIAAQIMPCHYCGVEAMGLCPSGFPGCALADDFAVYEDQAGMALRAEREAHGETVRELERLREGYRAIMSLLHDDARAFPNGDQVKAALAALSGAGRPGDREVGA